MISWTSENALSFRDRRKITDFLISIIDRDTGRVGNTLDVDVDKSRPVLRRIKSIVNNRGQLRKQRRRNLIKLAEWPFEEDKVVRFDAAGG